MYIFYIQMLESLKKKFQHPATFCVFRILYNRNVYFCRMKQTNRNNRLIALALLVMLCGWLPKTQAQQFKLVEDTVMINAADYISPISDFEMKWAAKYHGY